MPSATNSTYIRYAMVLLAGALLPLALAPLSWWPVAIASSGILATNLRATTLRQATVICLLFGFGLYATGASWIYVSIHQYGQAPAPLAALLTGLFALGLAVTFALPIIFYARIKLHQPLTRALTFAALWVLGEWFRGWFLTGFPWLYLGYGFIDTWLAGWAPLGGVLAISGIVAFSGAFLGEIFTGKLSGDGTKSSPRQAWKAGFSVLLLVILWLGGGLLQNQTWTTPMSGPPLQVTLVQPNNPVLSKWEKDALPRILAGIWEHTLAYSDSDLIIWPESAIPALQQNVQAFLEKLHRHEKDQDTALIIGMPNYIKGQYFNTVIGLGTASGHYQKRRLVPFGEYVPLEDWLRGLIQFFDLPMSAFSVGASKQALISLNPSGTKGAIAASTVDTTDAAAAQSAIQLSYKIATAICYEIAYSGPVARDARLANLLLTVSNDTWFGNSLGPHQHLQIARTRALETGKPLLRATNDGITAVIDSQGRLIKQLPQFSTGVLQGQVIAHRGMTPYSRWGVLPLIYICLLMSVIATVTSVRRGKIAP